MRALCGEQSVDINNNIHTIIHKVINKVINIVVNKVVDNIAARRTKGRMEGCSVQKTAQM
jgi:hypothetical protein